MEKQFSSSDGAWFTDEIEAEEFAQVSWVRSFSFDQWLPKKSKATTHALTNP